MLSVKQFSRSFLHQLFNLAHDLRIFGQRGPLDILRGVSMASVFYEPSTRTSCSFTAAMHKLGGTVINLCKSPLSSWSLSVCVREGVCSRVLWVLMTSAARLRIHLAHTSSI